jgi:hypothetical protein
MQKDSQLSRLIVHKVKNKVSMIFIRLTKHCGVCHSSWGSIHHSRPNTSTSIKHTTIVGR